jgi:nicotinamide riboside transporter PnuC
MDWLAACCIILSIIMIGRLNKWGWIVAIVGAILYIIVSYQKGIYGFIFLDCVLLVINTLNFIKWHQKEQQTNI